MRLKVIQIKSLETRIQLQGIRIQLKVQIIMQLVMIIQCRVATILYLVTKMLY